MPASLPRTIAEHYRPHRHHYWYARIKLATDPLYAGVIDALRDSREPLLDLGCGIGLLAHWLRASGFAADYHGVDNDAAKLEAAVESTRHAQLDRVSFTHVDLASGFPEHEGSVTLLDVLQFVPPAEHARLIDAAIDSLTIDSVLVIRSGLQRPGWRLRLTRAVDRFSRWWGWMNAGPQRYPQRADLEAAFEARGVEAEFEPLRGRTPFENWLIVVRLGVGSNRIQAQDGHGQQSRETDPGEVGNQHPASDPIVPEERPYRRDHNEVEHDDVKHGEVDAAQAEE